MLYVFSVGKGLPTADEFLKRILPNASIGVGGLVLIGEESQALFHSKIRGLESR